MERERCATELDRGHGMSWLIGGGVLYFILLVTLGIMSIRKGHWVMFLVGIIFPIFWLIGALMPRRVR